MQPEGTIGTPGSIVVWDKRGTNPRQFYQIDAQRNRLKVLHTTPNYDPRPIHWHQTALKAGKPTWTPIFFPLRIPTAVVAAVAPVYQDGELQGVLMSNAVLSHVNLFLNSLRFSPSGQVFIVELEPY